MKSFRTNLKHGNPPTFLGWSFTWFNEYGGSAGARTAYLKMIVEPISRTDSSYFTHKMCGCSKWLRGGYHRYDIIGRRRGYPTKEW